MKKFLPVLFLIIVVFSCKEGKNIDAGREVVVSKLTPLVVVPGSIAEISGKGFGTSTDDIKVLLNEENAVVQAVTPHKISIVTPVTTSGKIIVYVKGTRFEGPAFTLANSVASAYTGGNVILTSQAEVNAFVAQNKGTSSLQLSGALVIKGDDIRSASGLSNITSVANGLSLSGTSLTDVTFLNNITWVGGGITLDRLPTTKVSMDKLTGGVQFLSVTSCNNLRSLSFVSLGSVNGISYNGGLTIKDCGLLNSLDLRKLSSISDKLVITNTSLQDFRNLGLLKSAGSLSVINNALLTSFQGLQSLETLTLPAVSDGGPFIQKISINGLNISGNTKLGSLTGLQNLVNVPLAVIRNNVSLTDLCPAKKLLTRLSMAPDITHNVYGPAGGPQKKAKRTVLTMDQNGKFTTRQDALAAISACK